MIRTFDTIIQAISPDRLVVALEATAFYPGGGGQPADGGTIAAVAVVEITRDNDGTIRHHLDYPLPEDLNVGDTVMGEINWPHRWEYMQQHTGQHLLSAVLMKEAGANTVSVHQGEKVTTIEVDRANLNDTAIQRVEEVAQRVIAEKRLVRSFQIDSGELGRYSLRRPTGRTGIVRLVEIQDFDIVACGGVHLEDTAEVQLVKTVGVESIRGNLRLAFLIGQRALADYGTKHRNITAAAELFSTRPEQVPLRVTAMQEEVQQLHRTVRLQNRRIAELLLRQPEDPAGVRRYDNEPEDLFTALVEVAAEDPLSRVALVNTRRDTGSIHWAIVFGEGENTSPFPQKVLREKLLKPLDARGGGRPPLWRGVVAADKLEAFIAGFLKILQEEQAPSH